MSKDIIWHPTKDLIKNSKLTNFLNFCNIKNYDELEKKSLSNPGWFWENVIKFSNLKFFKSYTKIMDDSKGIPWTKWCVGGTTNIVLNCIDRHLDENSNKTALIWEGDDPNESKQFTYKELHLQVCKFANVLKELGVKKGSRVCIYMPMIPEAAFAMLACTRIGAIHSVVFG